MAMTTMMTSLGQISLLSTFELRSEVPLNSADTAESRVCSGKSYRGLVNVGLSRACIVFTWLNLRSASSGAIVSK